MPPEDPKKGYPEGQTDHPDDETPPAAPVEDRPSNPPISVRPSARPGSFGRIATGVAIGAGVVLAMVDERRGGPPTPRMPQVVEKNPKRKLGGPGDGGDSSGAAGNGGTGGKDSDPPDGGAATDAGDAQAEAGSGGAPSYQEDLCGPQSFAKDAKPEDMAKPGEEGCQFVTDADGKLHIIGHTMIDSDGIPRDCFVQPTFLPNAAMKIRGEIHGSPDQPGKIFLDKGKLCVMMLSEQNQNLAQQETKALVIGEASLQILTNQRVIVKILEPEIEPESKQLMHYAMVTPVEGEVLINQEFRDKQFHLKKGDPGLKIPLDKVHSDNSGCYIASVNPDDVEHQKGGLYILGAGAIFMVLRRRGKPQNVRLSRTA